MDNAVMTYDYIANGGTTTLGGDSRSPLMIEAARQRFFDTLRDQLVTDVYAKLRVDNISRLTTNKEFTKSFVAKATGYGIKVWINIEVPYWDFDGDGSKPGEGIEKFGPYLVQQASTYNLSVPAESRIYGVWFYVDYNDSAYNPQTSWNRSAALAKSMKAADKSGMQFCYWLGWHYVSAGLSELATNVDMFELDGYASTLAGVISRLNGRADAIEAYGKPFRISLSCDFHPSTPYNRYISSGWPVATQADRLTYINTYFNAKLVPEVNRFFSQLCPHYTGVGIQSYKWGMNTAYPLDFAYTPPVVVTPPADETDEPDPVTLAGLKTDLSELIEVVNLMQTRLSEARIAILETARDNLQARVSTQQADIEEQTLRLNDLEGLWNHLLLLGIPTKADLEEAVKRLGALEEKLTTTLGIAATVEAKLEAIKEVL